MRPVLNAAQMRAMDAETIAKVGIPGAVLMENAGRAVALAVRDLLPAEPTAESRVTVLCGSGNNGGDGFVAARVLQEEGVVCELFLVAGEPAIGGDASLFLNAFKRCGGTIRFLKSAADVDAARSEIEGSSVLVDAIFGTGLCRNIEGHLATLIECINQSPAMVVAVDLPSGLLADTGAILGVCVRADVTVTMAAVKVANVGAPGFAYNGHVEVAEIGIPRLRIEARAQAFVLTASDVVGAMPDVDRNGHKGRRGHVLAVAGSDGKRGAGRLAALAALRSGAGLVTIAAASIDSQAADPIMSAVIGNPAQLAEALVRKAALLIGPGMDTGRSGAALVKHALANSSIPMVLDADALNHLVGDLSAIVAASAPVVLTPHPGEAARMLEMSIAEVQADRMAAVRLLARETGAVVVLKGARTCICDGGHADEGGDGVVFVCDVGGPELATAGTGDVLSGVLAALLAQGLEAPFAAALAVYWHGIAGSCALDAVGGPGVIASDVIDALPVARTKLQSLV
ncbi:MAG: NAD(P)H-hydrate dehydratase [Kofleriaceae bacterium]|nr:NAD(P)H-hydrate dehydratase [Kofleriaceae bacterium]